MSENEHIPVFFASDDNYAKLVAATAVSILENTKSFVDFIVLDNNISERNKNKIKLTLSKFTNSLIKFVNIDKAYLHSFPSVSGAKHVTKTMYSRFLIPKLFPEYKKAIYSDVDIIYTQDIKKLYDEPLDGYTISAIPAAIYLADINHDNCRNRLNIDLQHKYFSSGFLLIDIQQWIKSNIDEKILEICKKYRNKLLFGDQDILNICFNNNYKILNPKYSESIDLQPPAIIHFFGAVKPWNTSDYVEYADLFWKYARKTLFYGDFRNFYVPANSKKGIFLKIAREIMKLMPYFLVHREIKKIDNKITK